jgi:hypothetical protein
MAFSCKTYVTIAGLLIAPCLVRAQMPGAGRVKVKSVQSYSGTRTLTKPTTIVVYSFAATQEEVELNKSALNRARMHTGDLPPDSSLAVQGDFIRS